MKLKIELNRYETLLYGRVLEMDESLRGKTLIARSADFEIRSSGSPELTNSTLYLRGREKLEDNRVFSHTFPSEKAAIETGIAINALVDEINKPKEITITEEEYNELIMAKKTLDKIISVRGL